MTKVYNKEEAQGWFLNHSSGSVTCVYGDKEFEASSYPKASEFFRKAKEVQIMAKKIKYTREMLIDICEKAIVNTYQWGNRDTAQAQIGVGTAWVLLKAGCKFEVTYKPEGGSSNSCVTDQNTIWIQFFVTDFYWFDGMGREEHQKYPDGRPEHDYHFFLPTQKRLDENSGGDWY